MSRLSVKTVIGYENISRVASIKISRIFTFRFQLEASENK